MEQATTVYSEEQFINDLQAVFRESRDPVLQAQSITRFLKQILLTRWPESSPRFGSEDGMYVIHADNDYGHPTSGFMVLAYRQKASPARPASPHDHGTCFVVYGVASGSNTQVRYHWDHSRDTEGTPVLDAGQEVLQQPGDVHYFLPGEIHSTQGSSREETIYVRVTSEDLDKVWRHRYQLGTNKAWAFMSATAPPVPNSQ